VLNKTGDYSIESERDWYLFCNSPRDIGILTVITTNRDKTWKVNDKEHFTFFVDVREYLMPNGRVQPRVYGATAQAEAPSTRPYSQYLDEWEGW
jgi:hypothetical protein